MRVRETTVLSSLDDLEIELARNVLDQGGIPCVVKDTCAAALLAMNYGAGMPRLQRVRVLATHAYRARELLEGAWGPVGRSGSG